MTLYTETLGTGPDVVMLHGWGMHSGIWHDLAQLLAQHYRVTLIDLPGHGYSNALPADYSLDAVAALIAAHAPDTARWIGWSLGGLIAQHLALHHAARVTKLALIASTPQFVTSADWPDAMDAAVLDQFAQALVRDYRATLSRFLALEVHDSADARAELRELRQHIFERGEPNPDALRGGLEILRHTNLRPRLGKLAQPLLLLLGERDNLVPRSAGSAVQSLLPQTRVQVLPRAAHAPFLIHPAECATAIREFFDA